MSVIGIHRTADRKYAQTGSPEKNPQISLPKRSSLFPFSVSVHNLAAKIQMDQVTGRSKKYTTAGIKLAHNSGLVFNSQLQDKEYVYLNAAEFGEVEVVRELINDPKLDVNCVDYMGRNALLLAIKNENIDLVNTLVGALNFYAIEDALLHAISQDKNHLVKLIVDHPQYIRLEKQAKTKSQGLEKRPDQYGKRSQFSSDISPMMLAAHMNNHEIIQLLLDRGVKLEMPHDRSCACINCETTRAEDSLILELQRLHTYQALSSSAYLALTTSDPVSSAFSLRDELYQLASQEKQFKEEYSQLAVKCMEFAVSCIDLCRTSDEVHCLLRGDSYKPTQELRHPLDTVKNAISCREKKFVAHPNCQHQLENLFYNPLFCIRDLEGVRRLQLLLIFVPLLPFLYILYLFFPRFKMPLPEGFFYRDRNNLKYEVAYILRCPVVKFIGSMVSYMTFLILITVATFRLDTKVLTDEDDNWRARSMEIWSYDFRTSNLVMTKIQIILLFWILGNLAMAAKQVYHSGLRYIFRSYYNVMDWASLVIYLASYSLRIIVDFKVQSALTIYQDELRIAQGLLDNATCASTRLCPNTFPSTHNDYVAYRNHILTSPAAYWLRGCRLWWAPDDPEYVSDCLFALGNVLSFARISHLMPAWELLGPLQISLARMISDIIRFMTLFVLMMTAFVVGLTNLYWYFSNIIVSVDLQGHLVRYASGIPAFRSTGATFYTLYWALFGQSSNNVTTVDDELAQRYPGHESLAVASSPAIINNLGSILYATYNACMIIILLNMLIAMMSKSFDEIQGDKLEEWKFARASLWMVYIDQEGVLPVPLNLLPSREALGSLCERLKRTVVPKRSTLYTEQNRKIQRSRQNLRNTVWANDFPQDNCDDFAMAPHTKMKKTITVSTTLDTSPVHVNNWISDDSEIDSVQEKPEDEFREYTDITRTNVLRRFLFKLQEQRELQSKGTDLSIMNYQRQQKTEEKDALQTRGSVMSRRESKGVHQEDAGSTGSHEHEDTNEDRLRGLSSLLMPPSVRKKLEAVAAASSQINDDEGREAAEAVARYYLLETTRKNKDHEEGEPIKGVFNRKKKMSTGSWKSRASIEEPFTARTERPVKGAHLRELYKVEQEMHDMSEALSSQSLSEATISEINELERI